MQDYDDVMDDHVEDKEHTIEDTREELLEEDEISSREEAFMKGYEDAGDEEDSDNKEEE